MDKATEETTCRNPEAEDRFWEHLLNVESLLLLLSESDNYEPHSMRRALAHVADVLMMAKEEYFVIEHTLEQAYKQLAALPKPDEGPKPLPRDVGNGIIAETRRLMNLGKKSRKAKGAK